MSRIQTRVAVTVFVDADGVDERDAHNIAEAAVRQAMEATGDTITVHTHLGAPREVRPVEVMTTGAALRSGALTLVPAPGR